MTEIKLAEIKIEYDDDILNILDKVNQAISDYGFIFEDDGNPHDGFCILSLIKRDH